VNRRAWGGEEERERVEADLSFLWVRLLQDLVDIDLFLELQRIERSIQAGSCSEALAWCGENRGTLKKMKVGSSLSFFLSAASRTHFSL